MSACFDLLKFDKGIVSCLSPCFHPGCSSWGSMSAMAISAQLGRYLPFPQISATSAGTTMWSVARDYCFRVCRAPAIPLRLLSRGLDAKLLTGDGCQKRDDVAFDFDFARFLCFHQEVVLELTPLKGLIT
jgi:hypothetical protein